MNDQVIAKAIIPTTFDAANFDGANARTFERVVSSKPGEQQRSSSHINSLSPTLLRVAHQPRTAGNSVQRSLCALEQTLARLDAQSNLIGSVKFKVGNQFDIPEGVTLEEARTAFKLHCGLMLENDMAMFDRIYRGEQ